MNSRKLIIACAAAALCGAVGWRWMKGPRAPESSATARLDAMEAKARWNVPREQAALAIQLVTEARRTRDPALWDRAALAAQRALAYDPERVDAEKVQLLVMQNQHRFQEMKDVAAKLLEKHPHDGFLAGLVGDAELEMGHYPAAEAAYQRMVDEQPNHATYGRIAYLRMIEGDLDGAIEMGEFAARTAPQTDGDAVAWALCDLADVYLARQEPGTALRYFDTALAASPHFSRAHEGRGHVLRAQGKLDEAIAAYRRAVEIAATAQHLSDLSDALAEAGQAPQAADAFERALKASQGDGRMTASLLIAADRDLPRALTLAQEEYQRRQDVFTEDVLAYAQLRNGRAADAAQGSKQALRMGTRDARLSFHAGAIAEAEGDAAAARRHFDAALHQFPPLPTEQLAHARTFLAQHLASSTSNPIRTP
jgi:tetratricopeptide (TPR) repeat protein